MQLKRQYKIFNNEHKFIMLKKLIIFIAALVPMAIFAQSGKIAYINSQEIFMAMPEVPDIEKQLNDKQEQVKKNAEALQTEYNTKLDEFSKAANNTTVSDAVKQDQQKQLIQIQERYQQFLQNSDKEQQELYQKLVAPVNKKIADAIKAVGDEKGYAYIFDIATQVSPIVYIHNTSENATPLVKTKLGLQ